MLYARMVRSPHPHARVACRSICGGEAGARREGRAGAWSDPADETTTVMFQGDEVAAVAADTEERAIDAARLVKVEYKVLPHVIVVDQALPGGAGGLHEGQRRQGQSAGNRRPRGGFQGRGAHARGDLRDARHHARLPRVARDRVRMGRRQADGLDLDAGRSIPRARTSPAR